MRDTTAPGAAGRAALVGRRATRRTVIIAATGVLGTIGAAACTGPAATDTTPPNAGTRTGSTRAMTAPSHSTGAGGASTRTATPTGGAASVLGTSGPDLQSGSAAGARVALTFHGAGATALTAKVLQIAKAHDAKLTVFAVGQWLSANPQLGRAILAAGHDLGNHTWSHQPMRSLSAEQAGLEVSRGAAAVAAVRGSAGLLFRPSGTPASTDTIRTAALASGYHRCISYDVDPSDYLDPGTAAVRDRTLKAVRAGSIVSLHLGHAGTVAALPAILEGLRQRGLTAVTVTDLLTGA
ncbi:MAG: polysaccharide deacetylase family protein [Actinomycetota bacterium]|nr:polysaccharide deacetylase family protein [Actinomycetota bacterium]